MLEIWNKQENLIFPDGKVRTPEEIFKIYGWSQHTDTVIKKQGNITVSVDNLAILCEIYGVEETLSPEDALIKINQVIELQKQAAANPAPSAEERIASMLEFQALNSL